VKRTLGPSAYLLQLAAGIIALGVANVLVLPEDLGFLSVEPHPALLLVAVIATRHGLREGLMAAAVAGGLVLACWVAQSPDLTASALRSLGTYRTPLLFFAAGFILGAIRDTKRREAETLRTRVETLEHELADQAVRFMAVAEAKHELERRVAEEGASLSHLYAAARAMETLEIDQLYPAITATARRFLQADACQLYLQDRGVLRLRGAEGAPPSKTELTPDDGLVGLALRRGEPVSIRDIAAISSLEDLQSAAILLAAPLRGRDSELLGCLTVTRLPFLKLTPVALDRLTLVADWAARALENALIHQRTRARTIEDELVGAYSYTYFQRRLEEERDRAERYGRALAVLVFRIHDFEQVVPERRTDLARALATAFSRSLRTVDLVCRYATDDSFAVILPETTAADAEKIAARISRELSALHVTPYAEESQPMVFSLRVLEPAAKLDGVVS
jgi:polysaccharide biosynthesis protein PelD